MDDIVHKTFGICDTEKHTENLYRKSSEYKACNNKRVLKRYYDNEDDTLQKGRDDHARFRDLDNRLTELEQKLSISQLTTSIFML